MGIFNCGEPWFAPGRFAIFFNLIKNRPAMLCSRILSLLQIRIQSEVNIIVFPATGSPGPPDQFPLICHIYGFAAFSP